MSNSKKGGGSFQIPIPVIIIAYFLNIPLGVILTVLRILLPALDGRNVKNTGSTNTSSSSPTTGRPSTVYSQQPRRIVEINSAGNRKQAEEISEQEDRKTTRKKTRSQKKQSHSIPAIVLGVMAAIFLFAGCIAFVDPILSWEIPSSVQVTDILQLAFTGTKESLPLWLLSAATFVSSRLFKTRAERENAICSVIGNRACLPIDRLAAITGIPEKKAKKILQSLIADGTFGDEAYIDVEKNLFLRSPQAAPEEEEPVIQTASAQSATEGEEEDRFQAIIRQIRSLNEEIADVAVSERIDRIEEHTRNIFAYVTDHPESMSQIRSFMNYYLPTTLKLLESYSRIEKVGVAGENMKNSKEKIENILDMLVIGYEQQVDQLFKNESMDISSEITVLEAMMKQDGLSGKSDFSAEEPDSAAGISSDATAGGNDDAYIDSYTDGFSDDLQEGGAASQSYSDKK